MAARPTAPAPVRLVSRFAAVEDEIARLQEKAAQLAAIPQDDYPNQAIVVFEKKFSSNGITYTYVALKAGGYWYLTGDGMRRSWDSLMDKLYGDVGSAPDIKVFWVSELTPDL